MRSRFPIVLLLGLTTGLWGLGWGLPSRLRFRAFPMEMTADAARQFSDSWAKLYAGIELAHREMREEPEAAVQGVAEIPPGWTFPPPSLINTYRTILLQTTNPDEKKTFIILSHMHPRRLDFKPFYIFYGGAFVYPVGAFLELGALARVVTVVSDMSHYLQHPEDMGRMYWWARFFVILFSCATMWVLYDMGRRLLDENAGLWAAAFFCLCPIVTLNSHLLKPHPVGAFWCLAAIRFTLLAFEQGRRRDYILAGLCFGIGGGAVFPFAALSWLPALAWLGRWRGGRATRAEFGSLVACGFAAGAAFLLTNPYFAASPGDYRWDLTVYVPHGGKRWGNWRGFVSILASSWDSLGAALSVAAAAGLASALLRKERGPRLVAAALLGIFATLWLLFGRLYSFGLSGAGIRYYYPLFGLACVLAATGLGRLPRPWRVLLLGAVLLDTGLRGLTYLENMRAASGPRSTMNQASDWIESHVPAGASIGLARYPEPSHAPVFRYDRYRLVIFENPQMLAPGRYPEYLVLDEDAQRDMAEWEKGRYEPLTSFQRIQLGWARTADLSFYANVPVYVLRRKG